MANRAEPRLAFPAGVLGLLGALLALFAASAGSARAEVNVVSIEPAAVEVAPGGSFAVKVTTEPPSQSLAAWVIEVAFDPGVVTAERDGCNPIDTPGGAVGASGCEVVDTDGDGRNDAAKTFGAVLFTRTELGLRNKATLADITFEAVGAPGACTVLRVRAIIYADAEGEETGALVQDGQACIEGDAPPSGTALPDTPPPPRTSEPTSEPTAPGGDGGEGVATAVPGGDTGAAGGTDVAGRSPGTGSASGGTTGAGGSPRPSQTGSGGGSGLDEAPGDDGGGSSALLIAVAAVLVLGAAGAGAWYVVRLRRPPAV